MESPPRPTTLNERRLLLAKAGEGAARDYLTGAGYLIMGQNVRVGALEIDIIAEKNHEIVFVEVKTTGANYRPEERLYVAQQKRLFQAAERWLIKKRLDNRAARFDLVVVEIDPQTGEQHLEHHIDALRRDETRAV